MPHTIYITIAIALAVTCMAWSLWQRRVTFTYTWERAATIAIGMQSLAMLLSAPAIGAGADMTDEVLHSLTGLWEVADLVGDVLFIGAAAGFAYTVLSRALPKDRLARRAPRLIRLPATAGAVVMVVAYFVGDLSSRPGATDIISVPMRIYWAALSVTKIYLLLGSATVLVLLRRVQRHRTVANLYQFACINGILACLARVAATFGPPAFRAADIYAVWVFGSLWAVGFALAAAYSWHRKMHPFGRLAQAVSA